MRRRRWGLGPAERPDADAPAKSPGRARRTTRPESAAAADELGAWIEQASDEEDAAPPSGPIVGSAPWIGTAPVAEPEPEQAGPNPFIPRARGRTGPRKEAAKAPKRRRRSAASAGPGAAEGEATVDAATIEASASRASSSEASASETTTSQPARVRPGQPRRRSTPARNAGREKAWGVGLGLAGVVLVAGVVTVLLVSRGLPDLGGPDIPIASDAEVVESVAVPIWQTSAMAVSSYGIAGADPGGTGAVVAADVVVLRAGGYDDADVVEVFALRKDSGEKAWSLPLLGAVCAPEPVDLPAAPSGQVVACAGLPADGDGDPADGAARLLLLDQASGEIVVEGAFPGAPASIATTPDGVVVLERADLLTGVTPLRWFDLTGQPLWEDELLALAPEVRENLQRSSGYEIWGVKWARQGNALFLQVAGELGVRLGADGAAGLTEWADIEECTDLFLAPDVVACAGFDTIGVADDGRVRWIADDSMVISKDVAQPALLVTCWCSDDDRVYRLDVQTGERGVEVARLGGIITMTGTSTVPILRGNDRIVGLTTGGGRALWARPFDSGYGDLGITVVGDRIVLPSFEADVPDVVIDAATGAETMRAELGTLVPVGGRQALLLSSGALTLVDLP